MQRIAVPMIGGMVSSTLLTLIVIPAIYAVAKGLAIRARLAPSAFQTPWSERPGGVSGRVVPPHGD
jgi:hypothetical protein